MLPRFAIFLCLLAGCPLVLAEEQTVPLLPAPRGSMKPGVPPPAAVPDGEPSVATSERQGVHFTFAVPDYDSRVSLGVFDESGRLVRSLAAAVPEADFRIGLNGLMADWDWRDKEGQTVEEGVYFIRGFAVGLFVETMEAVETPGWGEVFGGDLALQEVQDMAVGPGGSLIILATDIRGGAMLLAYDTEAGRRLWSRSLGAGAGQWVLGQPAETVIAVMGGDDIELIDPANGRVFLRGRVENRGRSIHSLRLEREELQWVTDAGVQRVSLEDLSPLEPLRGLPPGTRRYFGDGAGGLALDAEGRIWTADPNWTVFLHQEGAWFRDFAPGREGRFWALVREHRNGQQRLGQFRRDGDFLRQIQPQTFLGTPGRFAVGNDETTLFVLSTTEDEAAREIVGIRRKILDGPSAWETFWQKRVDPVAWLQEDGFRPLPLRMKLDVTSALGRGRETSIFRLVLDSAGIRLLTADGLDLGLLWKQENLGAASAVPAPGNPGGLNFRAAGRGELMAGGITGLERIARIEAGRFVWPPGEMEE